MKEPANMRARAQELRRNATREEQHLWYDFLKTYPVQFNRQKMLGKYIVDFYCDKARVAIELDGSQHYEENSLRYDEMRTRYLREVEKIKVLRFTNHEVRTNFEGVCAAIDLEIRKAFPSSAPVCALGHLPPGEG